MVVFYLLFNFKRKPTIDDYDGKWAVILIIMHLILSFLDGILFFSALFFFFLSGIKLILSTFVWTFELETIVMLIINYAHVKVKTTSFIFTSDKEKKQIHENKNGIFRKWTFFWLKILFILNVQIKKSIFENSCWQKMNVDIC